MLQSCVSLHIHSILLKQAIQQSVAQHRLLNRVKGLAYAGQSRKWSGHACEVHAMWSLLVGLSHTFHGERAIEWSHLLALWVNDSMRERHLPHCQLAHLMADLYMTYVRD